jgi:hypothetical protein
MLEIIIEIKEKDNSIFGNMPMLLFFLWLAVNYTVHYIPMLTINKYMDCPCAHERR